MPRVDVPKPQSLGERMVACAGNLSDPTGRGPKWFTDVQEAISLLTNAASIIDSGARPARNAERKLKEAAAMLMQVVDGAGVVQVCCCGGCYGD